MTWLQSESGYRASKVSAPLQLPLRQARPAEATSNLTQLIELVHELLDFVWRSEGCPYQATTKHAQITKPFEECDEWILDVGEMKI